MSFSFKELDLEGAYVIESFTASDNRGRFTKSFEKNIFSSNGIEFSLNETFASTSKKNVIRGLHFQTRNPQSKLVTILSGKAFDVLVDIRPGSKTFGQWRNFTLSAENGLVLFIPRGFAHGFASLEENTVMLYQCDGDYDKGSDTGIRFNDPDLNIKWPIDINEAIVSERDSQLMTLKEYCCNC